MASDKGLYVAAAVVIAFGLSNSMIKKHIAWIDCLSNRVEGMLGRVSEQASDGEIRLASLAGRVFSRSDGRVERGQDAMVRVQMKLACAQARIARRQAEMTRAQAEKVRVEVFDQVRSPLVIERQNARTNFSKRRTIPDAGMI
jgi:hypothetical protein